MALRAGLAISLAAATPFAAPAAGIQVGENRIDVCGAIVADTTWTPDDVYVITCEVTVASGVTLTVMPGTIVKAYYGNITPGSLTVLGRLVAEGTPAAPIVFTSIRDDEHGGDTNADGSATVPGPGDWQSINFEAGSSGSISNALIAYGGKWYFYDNEALIRCTDADIRLDRVILRASYRAGLSARRCGIELTNGTLAGNGSGLDIVGLAAGTPFTLENNVFGPGPAGVVGFDGNPHGPVSIHDNVALGGTTGLNLRGTLRADLGWRNDELVLLLVEGLIVAPEATLRLAPGSVVKSILYDFGPGGLEVNGALMVEGTPEAPIVFTSLSDDEYGGDTNADGPSTGLAGQWSAVTVNAGGRARIAHAEVLYGGGYTFFQSSRALLRVTGGEVLIEDVTLRGSAWSAVYAEDGSVLMRDSRMEDNAWNVLNDTPEVVVDARRNWWGDPSGPRHATKNPDGEGKDVSDGVLFFPWAVDAAGTVPVQVNLVGPVSVSPGETVQYAVSYHTGQPITDAVLVFALPAGAEYVDGSPEALLWVERGEVFWRLGDLAEGDEGELAVRVHFAWGIPRGTEGSATAILVGADFSPEYRDVEPYLSFAAPELEVTARLTPAELEAERRQHAEFDGLCSRALAAGFAYAGAVQVELARLGAATLAFYERPADRSYTVVVHRQGEAFSFMHRPAGRAIEDASGGVHFDTQTFEMAFWGTWTAGVEESSVDGASARQPARCTEAICFRNCMAKELALGISTTGAVAAYGWWAGWLLAPVAVPSLAVGLLAYETYGYFECGHGCAVDPTSHCCEADEWTPFTTPEYPRGCRQRRCLPSQVWSPLTNPVNCQKGRRCVLGLGCTDCPGDPVDLGDGSTRLQVATDSGHRNLSCQDTFVRVAKDPNAKTGPAGDVLPGQQMTYTVEFENEGEGTAYGVYVTDELGPQLDETTLELDGAGEFFPLTRTIVWDVGELAPKGEPGSKGERTFGIRAKPGLPSGTVIPNQAIVYFPSVPEETATNTVVNVVQPLAAVAQSLETPYGTPIAVTLTGRDVSGTPLTYAIEEEPLNGSLTGVPPNLTYTPPQNFTGQTRLTFTVSNGVSTSRRADVTVLVLPSSADTIAPEVMWTYPSDGSVLEEVPADPTFSDETGPLYAPSLLAGFSEAMDPSTITEATVRVVGGGDREVPASVVWVGTLNQAVLYPRETWREDSYTATVSASARDTSGNQLAVGHAWSFRIGAATPGCTGDCDGGGTVTVDELVRGVNIALGLAAIDQCSPFDPNADGTVSVDEVVKGVANAIDRCRAPQPST